MAALEPVPIVVPPGVVLTESKIAASGRWVDMDKIRFVEGRPQKVGGFVRAVTTPTSGNAHCIHAWRDLNFNNYLAAGTYRKLYVYDTGWAQNDITPYRATGTLGNNPFTTVNTSTSVTVNQTGHNVNAGDTVVFAGATTFNNVTMNGTFLCVTVVDVNNYTVTATTTANASGAGGGNAVTYSYEISVGVENGTFGYGYGVGGYGLGTYGTARTQSTIFIEPRIWSFDHFGKILVGTYNGGQPWIFDPTQAQPWPRAITMSSDAALPTNSRQLFVTDEGFVFVLSANMLVQWCSQNDYTTWTPATSNTANSRTLRNGTKLVGGCKVGPELAAVWSDASIYIFQYTGSAVVYNSRSYGTNCGLIAPLAGIAVAGVVYWMGTDNFWMFDGTTRPMPNVENIRKYVFDNLTSAQTFECAATYNPKYNEIEWTFAINGSLIPNFYVTFHLNEKDRCWSKGTTTRMHGTNFTQGDTRPYFSDSDGYIYQHENTNDANGSPLAYTLTLAPYAMQDGLWNMQIERINWDFFQQSGTISITVNAYDRMTDAVSMDTETDSVTPTSGITDMQMSGRYISVTISDNELGSYMRLGKPVAFARKIGKRP